MNADGPRHLGLLVALVGFASLAACSEAAITASFQCTSDSQCDAGLHCDYNLCVVPDVNALELSARVIPPPSSGLLPQHLPSLTFTEGPDRLIRLLAPKVVSGVVVPERDAFTVNVPGLIEVTTPGDIAGLTYRFTARSRDGVDEYGVGFELMVLPGRRYIGTFRADDPMIPPAQFVLTAEDIKGASPNTPYPLMLPAATDYVTIEGRLREQDYTPVGGARVLALLSDGSVAATGTTDAQRGRFVFVLPPGVTAVRLKVRAPDSGDVVFPEFTTEALAPSEDMDVVVPALPTGTESFDARIIVVGTEGIAGTANDIGPAIAVPGATVTIVGDLPGGTLRRTATTDETGMVRIRTLPGAYECLVTAPVGSPFASWHGRVTLATIDTNAFQEARIALTPRVPLVGTLTRMDGTPVTAGTVVAKRRIERADNDVLALAPQPYQTTIDAAGVFQVYVDPGLYDLRVLPDQTTSAPAIFVGEQRIDAGLELDLTLPDPGLAHLTVATPDGTFLPGVTIELFLRASEGDDAQLLVKGVTGESGFVDLLVPYIRLDP